MTGPALPRRSARRDELLERLLVAVTTKRDDALKLRDRTLSDPTIALLDAWATVEDVLGFYLDRIADEGYLATAREPGSILALAELVARRPRPGIAASVHLAYALNDDPADNAVVLAAGLLSQSVAGPGELPQTFETTTALVARPSWNVLSPKRSKPLTVATQKDAQSLTTLMVAGTTANLASNDVLLLDVADPKEPPADPKEPPAVLRVATAKVDTTAAVTSVALQPAPGQQPAPGEQPAPGQQPASGAAQPGGAPTDVTAAIDTLIDGGLAKTPAPVPAAPSDLRRDVKAVFSRQSDATPRLLSALRPAVAQTLYKALDDTPLGPPSVTTASVLRVTASPFGAQAAPKVLFDERGQPDGTEDWPIGDTHTLRLSMTVLDFAAALQRALEAPGSGDEAGAQLRSRVEQLFRASESTGRYPVLEVGCAVGALSQQTTIVLQSDKSSFTANLGGLGQLELSIESGALVIHYTHSPAGVQELTVRATLDLPNDAVILQFDGDGTFTWDPEIRTPVRAQVAGRRLSIAWLGLTDRASIANAVLTASIETPLPVSEPKTLALDGVYDGILPGTRVVIERAGSAATEADDVYPVVASVQSAGAVAVSRYGITAKVTQLELDKSWIGTDQVLQTALRDLTVRAQPDQLDLHPLPIDEALSHDTIELDSLVAGMAPGRLILVRGIRADLPGATGVQAGEVAMVADVTSDGIGEPAHTTLHLSADLAYAYRRDSVEIFGNVVPAHLGATIDEVLGSGDPSKVRQSFTLATAPLLADALPTGAGAVSTLTVTVNGVGYQEVDRIGDATPPRSFVTRNDPRGHVTITFAAPLPAGSENARASYRAGDGASGNVRPDQVTQLLSRPAGVASVTNPLAGSGGSAGDGPEVVRANSSVGLRGLGRVVTPDDYADLALGLPAIGKAAATTTSDGRRQMVVVTVAGLDPVVLDPEGSVCTGVSEALAQAADPFVTFAVLPADLSVIVLGATVTRDPLVGWHETEAAVRTALLAAFGYDHRELGQDVAVGDLIAAAHTVPSVRSFTVTALALVSATASASDVAVKLPVLLTQPVAPVLALAGAGAAPSPAGLAYLTDAVADTLILTEGAP